MRSRVRSCPYKGRLAEAAITEMQQAVLADGLARLFAGQTDSRQCLAAATVVLRRFCVVAGGQGTGKTTTVARIVALLCEQSSAAGRPEPLVTAARRPELPSGAVNVVPDLGGRAAVAGHACQ